MDFLKCLCAEQYIPLIKPKVVICESAYWLAERATDPWSVTSPISISQPFFKREEENIILSKPLYHNWIYDLVQLLNSNTERSYKIALKCWAFIVRDDFRKVFIHIKSFFNKDVVGNEEATSYFYSELEKLCKESGSLLLIVGLDEQHYPPPKHLHFIETQKALSEYAKKEQKELSIFQFWYGDPPLLYDSHYNELAHKIISEEIIKYANNIGVCDILEY